MLTNLEILNIIFLCVFFFTTQYIFWETRNIKKLLFFDTTIAIADIKFLKDGLKSNEFFLKFMAILLFLHLETNQR